MGLSFPLPNPVPVAQGGTGTQTVFTTGSVVLAGTAGIYAQDNANLFWDATNRRLGLGTATPNEQLELTGNLRLPVSTATTGHVLMGTNLFFHNLGTESLFLGRIAGNLTNTGSYNIGLGTLALAAVTTGIGNLGAGFQALTSNTTGQQNFGLGFQSLIRNATGSYNVAIGAASLQANVDNSANVGIGANALYNATADANIGIGFQAGYALTSGASNVVVGFNAGVSTLATGGSNVLMGANTDVAAAGTNYGLALGYGAVCASNECAFGPNLNVQTGYGTSSTQTRPRADLTDSWVSSTDSTRKGQRIFNVWDTLPREAFRIEASGTGSKIGFLGATAVGRGTVSGSRGGNAALASFLTVLAGLGLITDATTA